ncbi:MAG: zinc ribbon domain-containing protein [Caldilineaceae bacterium]
MAVPNLWRTKHERYSLQGMICPECSQAVFPPRLICPHCHQPMGATNTKKEKSEICFTMPQAAMPELKVAADD